MSDAGPVSSPNVGSQGTSILYLSWPSNSLRVRASQSAPLCLEIRVGFRWLTQSVTFEFMQEMIFKAYKGTALRLV
jgi:hypothetical protein